MTFRFVKNSSSLVRGALLAGVCVFGPLENACADAFDGAELVADAELADARGGYITADGVTFDLGALISTYQNGELALQTQLTWTPRGAVATHVVGDPYSVAAQAAQQAATKLSAGGLAVTDKSGATQIFQGAEGNSLRNLVVTSASNTDFLQDIQVTITLPGFEAMQGGFQLDQIGIRLGAEVGDLLASAGRM
jgi:hypothetical protein